MYFLASRNISLIKVLKHRGARFEPFGTPDYFLKLLLVM